ncbi:MAG: hypothetical protein KAQ74_07240, partial [Dehalococcoidia bacterium]|nr:hypothetical protein [Dehalococcoidia bacterium]
APITTVIHGTSPLRGSTILAGTLVVFCDYASQYSANTPRSIQRLRFAVLGDYSSTGVSK